MEDISCEKRKVQRILQHAGGILIQLHFNGLRETVNLEEIVIRE